MFTYRATLNRREVGMTDGIRSVPEGYLTMAQARARLGVSKVTIARLVRAFGIQIYQDPRDARIKLVRVEDVNRLAQPRPRQEGKAAA
jgi:hypothetical protein